MTAAEWFAARIILQSFHDDGGEGLIESRIILVRAASEAEARSRAEALARDSAHEYQNADGGRVRSDFREVLDIKPLWLDSIGEGSEVYWEFLREDELKQIRRIVKSNL